MLRKALAADFEFIFGLYMHPDINTYLLYEPMDEMAFRPVFEELLQKQLLFIYQDGEEAIGMCKLVPQFHRNAHMIYLGGVAIHPNFAGKGHGEKMLGEVIALARKKGLRRIELSTATNNFKAIRLYEKMGFLKEGVLRNYTWFPSEDRFIDEVMMSWVE